MTAVVTGSFFFNRIISIFVLSFSQKPRLFIGLAVIRVKRRRYQDKAKNQHNYNESPKRRRVLSTTLSTTFPAAIPFISAIASITATAFAGSLRSPGAGPSTGLSVSTNRHESGSCFTSFCFWRERTIEGGIEKNQPASTAGMAADAFPSKAWSCTLCAFRSSSRETACRPADRE